MEAGIWCRFALGTVHLVCLGVLICASAAQGTVAVAIRNAGQHLKQQRKEEIEHGPVEILFMDNGLREKR